MNRTEKRARGLAEALGIYGENAIKYIIRTLNAHAKEQKEASIAYAHNWLTDRVGLPVDWFPCKHHDINGNNDYFTIGDIYELIENADLDDEWFSKDFWNEFWKRQ